MASIFRQQYTTTDAKGRKIRKKSAYWYIDYKGTGGVRKRVKGFKDKTATTQLAAKLEKEAELAEVGIVDRHKEHRTRPLSEHLKEFKGSLLAKGNTKKHAGVVFTRAKAVMEGCGFCFIGEVSASKVHQFLADLRNGGASIRTSEDGPGDHAAQRYQLDDVSVYACSQRSDAIGAGAAAGFVLAQHRGPAGPGHGNR